MQCVHMVTSSTHRDTVILTKMNYKFYATYRLKTCTCTDTYFAHISLDALSTPRSTILVIAQHHKYICKDFTIRPVNNTPCAYRCSNIHELLPWRQWTPVFILTRRWETSQLMEAQKKQWFYTGQSNQAIRRQFTAVYGK